MASRQMLPLVLREERQGNPQPPKHPPPQLTHTSRSSTWRSWPCRSAVPGARPGPAAPSPPRNGGRPRSPRITSDPLRRGGAHTRHQTLGNDAASPGSPPPPSDGGLRTGRAGAERGLGTTEPSKEPRHLLTVTGGASSSHLPSCFLAF